MGNLTDREKEVAKLVFKGKDNKSIAKELDITAATIKNHLSSIYQKLNISGCRELPKKLYQLNIVSIEDFEI